MTDTPPTHEDIEGAFKSPKDLLDSGKLPDNTESREAKRLLGISEQLAHESRERRDPNATMATGGPIATGDLYLVGERGPDLVFPTRGPAMTGWPWRWTDGTTP